MIVGMDELHAVGTEITFLVAPKIAHRIAGEHDGPVGSEYQNHVRRTLDQGAEVGFAAAQHPLALQPFHRLGDDIGDCLHEGGIVTAELARLEGMSAEYPVGTAAASDYHGDT